MTKKLYIIRHGLAGQFGDYADDAQRPLTAEGVTKTTQVALKLKGLGIGFNQLLTSPYQRAYQTAEILRQTGLAEELITCEALRPEGDFEAILGATTTSLALVKTVAVVGHEPDLSQLAERLIWGDVGDRLQLKKAGIICLEILGDGIQVGQCRLLWLVSPKLLLT
jgi:phosphohistidine phosphatase